MSLAYYDDLILAWVSAGRKTKELYTYFAIKREYIVKFNDTGIYLFGLVGPLDWLELDKQYDH